MVLVDTSVWIDHFRNKNSILECLLQEEDVGVHPYVLGELACGNFKNRREILSLLHELPSIQEVTHLEYMAFIEHHRLWGQGIGFVDIHVLASAALGSNFLFTLDRALQAAARKLHLAYSQVP